ncbi:MAG: hypothetical protein ACREGR_01120 [Minisyncoccia bacterium]
MFTQKQLERAYKQMQRERRKEADNAEAAAKWVREQLGLGVVRVCDPDHNVGNFYSAVTPYPKQYVIACTHETYGPHLEDYTKKLDTLAWAKRNDEWVHGFAVDTPFYDIDTPLGKFKLTFEYFDNHCTGY